MPNGQAPGLVPQQAAPSMVPQSDPSQTQNFTMEGMVSFLVACSFVLVPPLTHIFQGDSFTLDFANPMSSNDVLNDFDFDSFLHDNEGPDSGFDFTNPGAFMDADGIET